MKYMLGYVLGLVCAVGIARAEMLPPDALIRVTVEDVVAVIKADKDIQAGSQEKTLALVEEKVLPHFDFERMTQLAVGKHWRKATPEQRQALVREFRNMLVRTYTKVFSVYRDQIIEVKPLKMAAEANEVTVLTTITKPGNPPIPVNYEMKKKANGWKAFDIYIEGVSMIMNYRSTFAAQIQESGIDGLIKSLADKNIASSKAAREAEGK